MDAADEPSRLPADVDALPLVRAALAMRSCRAHKFSIPSARMRFRLARCARMSVFAGVNGVSLSAWLLR